MYFVYIIQNPAGKYYVGYTKNIIDRLKRHNRNRSVYTKNKGNWDLVYQEKFLAKGDAIKRENYIKSQKSREFIERLIKEQGLFSFIVPHTWTSLESFYEIRKFIFTSSACVIHTIHR